MVPTREERDAQPLCIKIESLLIRLMKTVMPYSIMKNYTIPIYSVFGRNGNILEYEDPVDEA